MKYTREGKPVTYIHYGSSAFSHVKFVPATQEGCWVKPKGGLWGSPVGAKHSWKDWCEGESFRECNEDNSFRFTVRDPKRIFYIDSEGTFSTTDNPMKEMIDRACFPTDEEEQLEDAAKELSDRIDDSLQSLASACAVTPEEAARAMGYFRIPMNTAD